MDDIRVLDKEFVLYIREEVIQEKIKECAEELNAKFCNSADAPMVICLLNGAAYFTVDLSKHFNFMCQIDFVKYTSYVGTDCSCELSNFIGLKDSVENRDVILVDDIIDSGFTMSKIIADVKSRNAKSVTVVTMIYKPHTVQAKDLQVDYYAIKMDDSPFIIGYGLDYCEIGRTLKDIYILKD